MLCSLYKSNLTPDEFNCTMDTLREYSLQIVTNSDCELNYREEKDVRLTWIE